MKFRRVERSFDHITNTTIDLAMRRAGAYGVAIGMRMLVIVLGLASPVILVESSVYLVRMNDSPVVHYQGSVPGYAATATPSGTKLPCKSVLVKKYSTYLETMHDQILATTFPEGGYTKLYSYSILVNGFAVDISEDKIDTLARHPDVMQLEVNRLMERATTYTPEYLGLPSGAWAENGGVSNAGEDLVIGLVDTGINPKHPSFGNDKAKPYGRLKSFTGYCEVTAEFPESTCNNKIVGARHFAAALVASEGFNISDFDDFFSPIDAQGHGTHTASTAAGNYGVPVIVDGVYYGKASGIAPRARVAMYKALYSGAGGTMADTLAAVDQAVADGVDILSLSIAPSFPPDGIVYFSILDVALLGAARAGVFVAQAAGNSGPYPNSVLSFSPWIVSVGASSTDRNYTNSVTLGNGMTLNGSGLAVGTPGSEFYNIVMATDVNITNDPNITVEACQSSDYFDKKLVEGNLLVCNYSFAFEFDIFTKQAVTETARNLSAAGLIYITDYPAGVYSPTLLTTHQLPAIFLSTDTELTEFVKYYQASTKRDEGHHNISFGAKAKLNGGTKPTYTGSPPVVAVFSSRGSDFDVYNDSTDIVPADVLKPNIMAPGVSIWAAWTPIGDEDLDFEGQSFAIISGTSMATPHIAGIAALVKEMNPSFSPAAIHSAIAGTAMTSDRKTGTSLKAQYPSANIKKLIGRATPFDMGAGQVDPLAALDPGLVFDADVDDYTQFLCLVSSSNSTEVRNATGSACPKDVHGYPSDLNTPYISVGDLRGSRVVPRTVRSVSKLQESFKVKIDNPSGVRSTVSPTSFTIAPGQHQALKVTLTPKKSSKGSSFGELHFHGNLGHRIKIPITVYVASR